MIFIVYGGATCPVMGAVFKTVCRIARVSLGGFDSHTPPPKISWQLAVGSWQYDFVDILKYDTGCGAAGGD